MVDETHRKRDIDAAGSLYTTKVERKNLHDIACIQWKGQTVGISGLLLYICSIKF
jgi:hypothetical protein